MHLIDSENAVSIKPSSVSVKKKTMVAYLNEFLGLLNKNFICLISIFLLIFPTQNSIFFYNIVIVQLVQNLKAAIKSQHQKEKATVKMTKTE